MILKISGILVKKLSKKVIVAVPRDPTVSNTLTMGATLREIRKLAGVTQTDLSERMGIKQSALSRLENRDDIMVSTLRNYVGALDARLMINAEFDNDSPVSFRIRDAFEVDDVHEDQFLLPIFEDEPFKPKRDLVLSIRPQYAEPILLGKKTIELRRRFPKNVPAGTFAYIYTTSPTRAMTGFAEIGGVERIGLDQIWQQHSKAACISRQSFDEYFKGLSEGFAINFRNPKRLHRSLDLAELRERFGFEPPQSFLYVKPQLREAMKYEFSTIPD